MGTWLFVVTLAGGCSVKVTDGGAVIVMFPVAAFAASAGLRSYACEVAVTITGLFGGKDAGAV